jgi:hypothetical protein
MVAPNCISASAIDFGARYVPETKVAAHHLYMVNSRATWGEWFDSVNLSDRLAVVCDGQTACIRDLATGFKVKWCLIQHDKAVV